WERSSVQEQVDRGIKLIALNRWAPVVIACDCGTGRAVEEKAEWVVALQGYRKAAQIRLNGTDSPASDNVRGHAAAAHPTSTTSPGKFVHSAELHGVGLVELTNGLLGAAVVLILRSPVACVVRVRVGKKLRERVIPLKGQSLRKSAVEADCHRVVTRMAALVTTLCAGIDGLILRIGSKCLADRPLCLNGRISKLGIRQDNAITLGKRGCR